jgi:protein DGCR14
METALMPPPPPRKRQKRPAIVLDEDEYAQAVSDIIARDYFPALHEMQAQTDYMEAVESSDKDWIREAGVRLTQAMTPKGYRYKGRKNLMDRSRRATTGEDTPRGYAAETPGQTPRSSAVKPDNPAVNINMSLGTFQAKYTSEDNESFNAILDKQNNQRSQKYTFLHNGDRIPPSRQLEYRADGQKLLGQGTTSSNSIALLETDKNSNAAQAAPRPSQDLAARPASLDPFPNKQGARNHFMFGPDGIEEQTIARNLPGSPTELPPKAVIYANTRLPSIAPSAQMIPPSPSMSAIDAAIAGRSAGTESEPGYSGAETPRVNGYAFVDSEPTPNEYGQPADEQDVADAEHTRVMRLLPKLDISGPNRFHIPENNSREIIHRKLVEQADGNRRSRNRLEHLRDLGITPGRSKTPTFASSPLRKGHAMTPAARRLADTLTTPRRASGTFGSQQRDRTPTFRSRKPV